MKRALLITTDGAGNAAPLGTVQPFSQALAAFKAAVADGVPPAKGAEKLELWASSGGVVKTHKFREDRVEKAAKKKASKPAAKGQPEEVGAE